MSGKRVFASWPPGLDILAEWVEAVFSTVPAETIQRFRDLLRLSGEELSVDARLVFQKPYGRNHILHIGEDFGISCAVLEVGQQSSFHLHRHRAEFYLVRSGLLELHIEDRCRLLKRGDHDSSLPMQRHRLRNPGPELLEVFEICSPPLLDDKVRIADSYGRPLGQVGRYR